jgi:hypothetical protein
MRKLTIILIILIGLCLFGCTEFEESIESLNDADNSNSLLDTTTFDKSQLYVNPKDINLAYSFDGSQGTINTQVYGGLNNYLSKLEGQLLWIILQSMILKLENLIIPIKVKL